MARLDLALRAVICLAHELVEIDGVCHVGSCEVAAILLHLLAEGGRRVDAGRQSVSHFQPVILKHLDIFFQRLGGELLLAVFVIEIFKFRFGNVNAVDGHDRRILGGPSKGAGKSPGAEQNCSLHL